MDIRLPEFSCIPLLILTFFIAHTGHAQNLADSPPAPALFSQIDSQKNRAVAAESSTNKPRQKSQKNDDKHHKRTRRMLANAKLFQGLERISINLFPGTKVEIKLQRTWKNQQGRQIWRGDITSKLVQGRRQAARGKATFIVDNQGKIRASVRVDGQFFEIEHEQNEIHIIKEIETERFPEDHPLNSNRQVLNDHKKNESQSLSPTPFALTGNADIKVLVLYTQAVAQSTEVSSLIDLAIDETNQSYLNSTPSESIQFSLVAAEQVDYLESRYSDMLINLSSRSDGVLDNIHDLRYENEADVVVLLVQQGDYCGIGNINAAYDRAFAVVNYQCAVGNYSFAHELGHLAGARHDIQNDTATTPYAYGHGYQSLGLSFRTIMAYNCETGNCPRVDYWSNPEIQFASEFMGELGISNNARVWRESAARIANLHESYIPPNTDRELWFFDIGNYVYTSPVVDENNTVYFAGRDATVYALESDMSVKWQTTVSQGITSSLVLENDTLYYRTYGAGNREYGAMDAANGDILWSHIIGGNGNSPAVAEDGSSYLVSGGSLLMYSAGGVQLASSAISPTAYATPAIGEDGSVYVMSTSGLLYSFSSDLDIQWTLQVPESYARSCLAIGLEGNIYLPAMNGILYAVSREGNLLWQHKYANSNTNRCPSLDLKNNLIIGGANGVVQSISPQGNLLWESAALAGQISSSAAIADNGDILIGTQNRINALSANGNFLWSSSLGLNNQSSVAIADNGIAYIGDALLNSGGLRAFNLSGQKLAATAWPRHHGGAKGSSRFVRPANHAPNVAIDSPMDGSHFLNSDGPIALQATAYDFEEGDLSSLVVWSSDLDGQIHSPVNLSIGLHTITASVSDSELDSGSDFVLITINSDENNPPQISIVSPANNSIISEDANPIHFVANASDIEDGNITANVQFSSSLQGAISSTVALVPGLHQITATVSDSQGATATETVSLEITAHVNASPQLIFLSPADGSIFSEDDNPITLTASALDEEDGNISANIIFRSSIDGITSSSPVLSVGLHQITATISDSHGASSSNVISLEITPHINQPPAISFVSPSEGYEHHIEDGELSFIVTASDLEDGDLSASVSLGSNLDGNFSSPVNLSIGQHLISASVVDSEGLSSSETLTINVIEKNVEHEIDVLEEFSVLPDSSLGWHFYSSNSSLGRIAVEDGKLRMDVTQDGNYNLNEAIFTQDLQGFSNVTLSFWQEDYNDESHALPAQFTNHFSGDGVAISMDGITWYSAMASADLETQPSGQLYSLNMDEVVKNIQNNFDEDFSYNDAFQIKLQQYDNYAYPTDGRAWDNFRLHAEIQFISISLTTSEIIVSESELGSSGCEALSFINLSSESIEWSASAGQNWLNLSPDSGSLNPGEHQLLDACWDSSGFSVGESQSASILLTDNTHATQYSRELSLSIIADLPLAPYSINFDSVLPTEEEGWEFYSSNHSSGRIRILNGRLGMDVSSSGNNNINEAILKINLAMQNNVVLSFFQAETSDENHSLVNTFSGHQAGDGVAISIDGDTWYTIVNSAELDVSTTGNTYTVNLDNEISRIQTDHDPNFDYTDSFFIKFQQYDNYPSPTDGREWDDISVTIH